MTRAREQSSFRRDFIASARAELARTASVVRASESADDIDDVVEEGSFDPYAAVSSWGEG